MNEPITVNEITPEALKDRLDRGDDVLVVDMRTPSEYQSGHIPSAVNIFVQEIPRRLSELPKDKDIVFQCWQGNTSLQAAAYLIDSGWSSQRIASLVDGIAGWAQTFGKKGLVQ